MNDISELFWQASLSEIKQGYSYREQDDVFVCLICGAAFVNGMIYAHDNQLYEAKKFIRIHIEQGHRSVFHYLLNLDKKLTGLTDHQKTILELFYQGRNDNEIAETLGIGSTSTIRNHRFSLREKQKQAKIFLALMELQGELMPSKDSFIEFTRSSGQVEDRTVGTEQENDRLLPHTLNRGSTGRWNHSR